LQWNDSGGDKVLRKETMKTISSMWVAVCVAGMAGAWPSALGQNSQPNPSAANTTKQFVAPARLIKRIDPIYPLEARQRVVQGAVVMKATIAADGTVKNFKITNGDPILRNSARDAVTQWRYEPARVEGVAFAVDTTITLNYSMGDTLKQSLFDLTQTQAGADGVEIAAPAPLPAPPAGVTRVSGRVMAGQLEKKVDPVYPADAIAADARGDVVLLATITKTGEVGDLQVVSGPYRFRDAAIEAVKQWRYRPYVVEGVAQDVQATITVNFTPTQANGAAR
jgi:TonB family protein